MKKYLLITSVLIIIFVVSCNTKTAKEELPLVLRADTLINTHIVKIIDTTSEGILSKAEFIDQVDTNKKIEKHYYQSGNVYIEGESINGKRNGLWKAWYDNGNLWSIGNYKNGEKDGLEETYYPNGNVRYSIIYKDGKEDGIAKYFSDKGELIVEREFENGNLISEKQINEK